MNQRIDPWGSLEGVDYARLRDEFGIAPFEYTAQLADPPALFRRGVVFGHRGFEHVHWAIRERKPWAVLTGLMPSGPMHLGHKMVIDQAIYFQRLGADVSIAVADLEAMNTRGLSLERGKTIAEDEYVANELALGLDPGRTRFYYQSRCLDVLRWATILSKRVNWSTMEALYGFTGETGMGKILSPLIQAADILHVQLPHRGGARPTLVPVGVDQDPHIRLTRDLAAAFRLFSIKDEEPVKGKPRLGVYVKVEEEGRNLERIGARAGVATQDVVAHLLGRVEAILSELGGSRFERNERYRAIYAAGLQAAPAIDVALARLEQELGEPGFVAPAATYHRLMTGLTGGKMSSSRPESCLRLSDDPADATKKLKTALTGGRATAEEQRRLGGEADKCPVYELYVYHLAPDDSDLGRIRGECTGGKMLCGECKAKYAIARSLQLLDDLAKRRTEARRHINEVTEP